MSEKLNAIELYERYDKGELDAIIDATV